MEFIWIFSFSSFFSVFIDSSSSFILYILIHIRLDVFALLQGISCNVIRRISGAGDRVDSNSLDSVIYVYTPVNHNVLLKVHSRTC